MFLPVDSNVFFSWMDGKFLDVGTFGKCGKKKITELCRSRNNGQAESNFFLLDGKSFPWGFHGSGEFPAGTARLAPKGSTAFPNGFVAKLFQLEITGSQAGLSGKNLKNPSNSSPAEAAPSPTLGHFQGQGRIFFFMEKLPPNPWLVG